MSVGKLNRTDFGLLLDAIGTAKECWMTDLRLAANNKDVDLGKRTTDKITRLREIELHLWRNKHVI